MSHVLPEGFVLAPEFITPWEEARLIGVVENLDFGEFQMYGVTAKRRVVHFGLRYGFESYGLTPAPAIPPDFESVRDRAAEFASVEPAAFSETLATEYKPGAGIGWHRDAPPFGLVTGISLAGACRMRFQKGKGAERITAAVDLPPRSIYLLSGSARKDWQHSIPPTKELRYSITFRTIRKPRSAPNA